MSKFRYFAYGSNMLTARLRERCPSAKPLGIGCAGGQGLAFHKRGMDGSGKATLLPEPKAAVDGVIFEIELSERDNLDRAEGPAYARHDDFQVTEPATGERITVTTYLARPEALDPGLEPFDWYMDLILAGAEEHRLPEAALVKIRHAPRKDDPDRNRPSRRAARRLLGQRED